MGLEFEKKAIDVGEGPRLEMENLAKRGQKHIKRAEKLEAEVTALHSALTELKEEKKRVHNMMLQQDEALQIGRAVASR